MSRRDGQDGRGHGPASVPKGLVRPLLLLLLVAFCLVASPLWVVEAYVGPGAGFAFISSFLTLLAAFLLGLFYLISSPIRLLIRALFGRRALRHAPGTPRRVVIVGLDGMDPQLAARFMTEGKLPHFSSLKEKGGFAPLATSYPAISPVAWSSFMTGVDASHHNIFDFITRDPDTYRPVLSSAEVTGPPRTLKIGRWVVPLSGPRIISYRKSRSFWSILGDHGVFSTVIRVPITFPVERFHGLMLAGMCVPDLRGSQGTFTFYTTNKDEIRGKMSGNLQVVEREGSVIRTRLTGPDNGLREGGGALSVPLVVHVDEAAERVEIEVGGEKFRLGIREYSPWVSVVFRPGFGIRVRGICRFYVNRLTPHFELYVTPLQIDPESPALPISHPSIYSVYLSRLLGRFATLGLAEDTSAFNEGVLDAEAFLGQTYLYHEEREKMFFNALEKTTRGSCVCVFDATDRIQHMFFRSMEDETVGGSPEAHQYRAVIEDLYIRMDGLIGRVLDRLGEDDVLFVMSDHGFAPFKRGVNLNTWLYENRYLSLKDGKTTSGEWFADVDWDRTRAFSLGLSGIFVNRRGREARGIVDQDGELSSLKAEIAARLAGLKDPESAETAITSVIDTEARFPGPYASEGPDLLVCYNRGYRSSWECATGKVSPEVFEENSRAWSGDHCMDPKLVPGVVFSNRAIVNQRPDIKDIAPTVLELFGLPKPAYMKGKRLV